MDVKLLYYVATEQNQIIEHNGIFGSHPEIGEYKVEVYSAESGTIMKGIKVPMQDLWKIREFLQNESNDIPNNSNIAIVENLFANEFALEISFVHGNANSFPFDHAAFKAKSEEFNQKFATKFNLQPEDEFEDLGKFALSNLLGGIGYFYGSSMISTDTREDNYILTPNYALLTDVPSRSVFPRGFLWDTGFHNMIISEWDVDLSLEILTGWLNLINEEGWIGREQIIGDEARSKVPVELIAQNPKYGNPPALLLPLMKIINANALCKGQLKFIFNKLNANFKWFQRTQRTSLIPPQIEQDSSLVLYQWKGRTMHHTLTSGLDDYPRGPAPHPGEVHLDLLCWMAFMSESLGKINVKLGLPSTAFDKLNSQLLYTIRKICFDSTTLLFYDAVIAEDGTVTHVKHKGYINLFPLIFNLLPVDSVELERSLQLIEGELWSPFGVMSLSPKDEYYGKGDNYWTGPVWININYMILRSLYSHYIPLALNKPHAIRLKALYCKLRTCLIRNMLLQFRNTGHIWEQYNPDTGRGQRAHPFTGWSSLVLLIIAERY